MKQHTVKLRSLLLLFLISLLCINGTPQAIGESESKGIQGNELFSEMKNQMADIFTLEKKRKAALEASAKEPLTEVQQQLLHQLRKHPGTLDEILSTQPYLKYLKVEVGEAYKNFPTYVSAMPTSKQKNAVLFSLKEVLPPNTKAEPLLICTNYSFALRELLVQKPEHFFDRNTITAFQTKLLMEPLIAIYSSAELLSNMPELMQMSAISTLIVWTDTEVFHNAWHERLKKYGPLEGLLRCAIATPTEFALVHSFFEDTGALEKWIQAPLKTEIVSKSQKKRKIDNPVTP